MARWRMNWLQLGCVLCVLWASGGAVSARAQDQPTAELVAQVLSGAEFGMTPAELLTQIKERIRERYAGDLEAAPGLLERDEIYERARREFRRIKDTYTKFDGRVTGWNVSPIGPEFRHGSDESMLYFEEEQYRDYFFFIRGKLWKCYRQFEPEAFQRRPFEEIANGLVAKLGPAEVQRGPRSADARPQRFLRWEASGAQLEAIDGGAHLVLVATDRSTLVRLAELRRNARSRKPREHAVINGILMTETELETWRDNAGSAASSPATRLDAKAH